jgi:2-keto-4-pentenoate hydratase/2-oxohepta-3-ene-1,7-dioic acid hydratase in catechol pathway
VRLLSYGDPDRGDRLGVVVDDRVVDAGDLGRDAPPTFGALLTDVDRGLARLRANVPTAPPATALALESTRLLPAVRRPGKVVAVGRNYREHAAEEGVEPPTEPLLFAKWPSSVVGPGAAICWDPELTTRVDWEAELGVIIGKAARRVSREDALDHVLGYTCLNDVSARDLQFGDGQWTRGKSLDTFCPIGPVVVTRDELDPSDLAIRCLVNGETVQDSRTSRMFFGVAEIISYCSMAFTLEPGDVIATGTPSGVGAFRDPPRFLQDGDEVVVEIEGIGRLVNRCRADGPVTAAAAQASGAARRGS